MQKQSQLETKHRPPPICEKALMSHRAVVLVTDGTRPPHAHTTKNLLQQDGRTAWTLIRQSARDVAGMALWCHVRVVIVIGQNPPPPTLRAGTPPPMT